MSDYLVRILPAGPDGRFDEKTVSRLEQFLMHDTVSDAVRLVENATPVFVDCGGNFEGIVCPCCGAAVETDWWGKAMNRAYKNDFADLRVTMPCCGMESTLNDLLYDPPCGFARMMVEISNPEKPLDKVCLAEIRRITGSDVRLIEARY